MEHFFLQSVVKVNIVNEEVGRGKHCAENGSKSLSGKKFTFKKIRWGDKSFKSYQSLGRDEILSALLQKSLEEILAGTTKRNFYGDNIKTPTAQLPLLSKSQTINACFLRQQMRSTLKMERKYCIKNDIGDSLLKARERWIFFLPCCRWVWKQFCQGGSFYEGSIKTSTAQL
ncbi:hypothetical protein QE152_g26225 [Popillia japonica]|uniref:Uncharacterized protein n=1 Tax=Popillia japonica TaxID=7064 RepID=A0AAW1JXY9_POPJA